jgi:maltooligosyltrehalose trehalohydrolase
MRSPVFEVWAPHARTVEIELVPSERRLRMRREQGGRHTIRASEITSGYFLRLDGGERVTDPRAPDVETVLGPCHRVDPSRFSWTDADFRPAPLRDALVYELHVGTFTRAGTFDGASERLDYLADLGVTHVELMPVATFSGTRGWGYDGAALFAPHRAYGGPAGLARFVDRAHARGLAVVLDVVYNHLGPVGNWLASFGPYFHGESGTPWGGAVNLDGPGSDEVRRFFVDDALMWLRDYHVDGLRLDAIHALHDGSAIPFLEQLAREVRAFSALTGKSHLLIAESDLNDPRVVRSFDAFGLGMDAAWSDDFHHALHVALTGESHAIYADFHADPLGCLATALEEGWVFRGQRSRYRGRSHGRPLGDVPRNALLGYAQTHDQVGNRPDGARLSSLVSRGRAKIALALTLTSPFTPMLFMGEEWAASAPFLYFCDHQDPDLARAVRAGRERDLAAMGFANAPAPDPQAESTFRRSILDWSETEAEGHADVLAFVRALVVLRRAHPIFSSGAPAEVELDRAARVITVCRGPFRVIANLGPAQQVALNAESEPLLGSSTELLLPTSELVLQMPADSVAILRELAP